MRPHKSFQHLVLLPLAQPEVIQAIGAVAEIEASALNNLGVARRIGASSFFKIFRLLNDVLSAHRVF